MSHMNKTNTFTRSGAITFTLFSGLAVALIFGLNFFFLFPLAPDIRGTIGDMFGLSNALFTGLAFIGLIATILMQRQELQMQREELALTRDEMRNSRLEMEGQKNALEQQQRTLEEQTHQQSVNMLLGALSENLHGLRYRSIGPGNDKYGTEALQIVSEYILEELRKSTESALRNWEIFSSRYPALRKQIQLLNVTLRLLDNLPQESQPFYREYILAHLTLSEMEFFAFAYCTRLLNVDLANRHGIFVEVEFDTELMQEVSRLYKEEEYLKQYGLF
jgi:hypothetical protein